MKLDYKDYTQVRNTINNSLLRTLNNAEWKHRKQLTEDEQKEIKLAIYHIEQLKEKINDRYRNSLTSLVSNTSDSDNSVFNTPNSDKITVNSVNPLFNPVER